VISRTMQVDDDDSDDSLNEEYIIAQGLRQSRERTNWLYRGTAIKTADLMDIEEIQVNICDSQNLMEYLVSTYMVFSILLRS
jgi:hypothetical protein